MWISHGGNPLPAWAPLNYHDGYPRGNRKEYATHDDHSTAGWMIIFSMWPPGNGAVLTPSRPNGILRPARTDGR